MDFSGVGFFGDSWVAGCEANEENGDDAPEFAFPSYFDNSINLGITGGSNDYIINQLVENLYKIKTAIFCLTDPARRYWVDENDKWKNGNVNSTNLSKDITKNIISLSNNVNDDLLTSKTCLLLYLVCKANNIDPYFVNMFGGQLGKSKLWELIPGSIWLLPKDKCIAQHCFDNSNWFVEFPNIGDFSYWLQTNNSDVVKYIRPCDAHPNKLGHKVIAEFISDKLNEI